MLLIFTYLNTFCPLQEAQADWLQSFLRPLMEPVNGCTVHNGWELPATNSQFVPHWRKAKCHLRKVEQAMRKIMQTELCRKKVFALWLSNLSSYSKVFQGCMAQNRWNESICLCTWAFLRVRIFPEQLLVKQGFTIVTEKWFFFFLKDAQNRDRQSLGPN